MDAKDNEHLLVKKSHLRDVAAWKEARKRTRAEARSVARAAAAAVKTKKGAVITI